MAEVMTDIPVWDTLDIYFSAMCDLAAVENLCLQKKLHSIKQRPEENTTAYILRFLSEAKLAYPTAWAMGEEGKVVSFLNGFTDRAFAEVSLI